MPNWEEIRREWETSETTLKALAEKHNVKLGTLKSRKSREKWSRNQPSKKDATKTGKVATINKKDATRKRGAPVGNKNAVGNRGGAAPKGNSNAVTHGFFRRIFPDDEETVSIIEEIGKKDPLDMLWENIVIQYTAIARAQKIMFVRDQNDLTKVLKRTKESDITFEEEYELQFAWDKHANFLQAQSRAISELRASIRQYEEMCSRGLATEEQQLRIDKLKAEIEKIREADNQNEGVKEWVESVKEIAERRKLQVSESE